ncbi:MAG: exodeoxyribonuclease III [Acidobacteria bacterium]|nr:exodeoxyribonuclease III [Acidobacteriota bacterium]
MPQGEKLVRIASWNVNGIRACTKSGLADWVRSDDADVVMLQEVRADAHQIPEEITGLEGYQQNWFAATVKKGYSGTGILSKQAPKKVTAGLGYEEFDGEGRVLTAEFEGFVAVSAYFPNSQDGGRRLDYKLRYCDAMAGHLAKLSRKGKPVVLGGDYNIAPYPIDLARPKDNEKNPGYLPEERAWMDQFLKSGWTDTWRELHPEEVKYSWWTARAGARERNVGWRIDFHVVQKKHKDRLRGADLLNEVRGSDHCPVTVELVVD